MITQKESFWSYTKFIQSGDKKIKTEVKLAYTLVFKDGELIRVFNKVLVPAGGGYAYTMHYELPQTSKVFLYFKRENEKQLQTS